MFRLNNVFCVVETLITLIIKSTKSCAHLAGKWVVHEAPIGTCSRVCKKRFRFAYNWKNEFCSVSFSSERMRRDLPHRGNRCYLQMKIEGHTQPRPLYQNNELVATPISVLPVTYSKPESKSEFLFLLSISICLNSLTFQWMHKWINLASQSNHLQVNNLTFLNGGMVWSWAEKIVFRFREMEKTD